MEIVIDIPDELVNDPTIVAVDVNYIKNGIVLPKGHGELIDRNALNLDYEVSMADDWKTAHEIANCVKYAPTVVEADKENKK